jgi:hypothetical protein
MTSSNESEQSEADRPSRVVKRKKPKVKKAAKTKTKKAIQAEAEEAAAQKKMRRRTATDDVSERKLRLALDVELPHLRYDVQHKGIHVIVSVRAQSAPNASLRASSLAATVGSPLQDKAGGGGHHHYVHNSGSASDVSQPQSGERAQIAVIAAIDRSSSMKGTHRHTRHTRMQRGCMADASVHRPEDVAGQGIAAIPHVATVAGGLHGTRLLR